MKNYVLPLAVFAIALSGSSLSYAKSTVTPAKTAELQSIAQAKAALPLAKKQDQVIDTYQAYWLNQWQNQAKAGTITQAQLAAFTAQVKASQAYQLGVTDPQTRATIVTEDAAQDNGAKITKADVKLGDAQAKAAEALAIEQAKATYLNSK